MKILNTIGEQFNLEAQKVLKRFGEVEYQKFSQDEFGHALKNFDAVIIGLGLRLDGGVIDGAPNLRLIATATTGLDHIDVARAQERGIQILSLQDEDLKAVTGTAELAWGLLISLVRHIPEAFTDVKNGGWEREKFFGNNLAGKTLGIVGLGRLGTMMAQYGRVFGMRVIAYDPYQDASEGAPLVDFKILLSESDIISIHAPFNKETQDLFNKKAFRQMKNSAYLINTSRGQIVNEADVLKALKSKTIAGYAADVLAGETEFGNDASDHPLVTYAKEHENVIITPHIGGYTAESRAATDIIIAHKVAEHLGVILAKQRD